MYYKTHLKMRTTKHTSKYILQNTSQNTYYKTPQNMYYKISPNKALQNISHTHTPKNKVMHFKFLIYALQNTPPHTNALLNTPKYALPNTLKFTIMKFVKLYTINASKYN